MSAPDETDDSPEALVRRREIRRVYYGLMITLALSALDQSIVATALPRIVGDLGGVTHLSWVVTAYVLTTTATMPLYGKLSDQYGRKPMIYAAILIFLAGSALCGLAQSMTQLIVFRAIQGLGAGGLLPLAQIIIGDLVPPRQRGRRQGLIGMVFAVSSVAGPIVGGIITDALSWHWIFYINLPVGLIAIVMIGTALRRRHQETRRQIDYAGAILLAAATTALLLVLSLGGATLPWLSPEIFGFAAATLVLAVLFVWREQAAPEPILPMTLFGNRLFVVACIVLALTFMGLMGASVFFPLFFQVVLGVDAASSGLLISALMFGIVISSFTNGRVMQRTGRYKPAQIVGLGAASLAFVGLSWGALTGKGLWVIEPALLAVGLGLGLVMPNMTTAVQNAVPLRDMGAATATLAFFRSLGGVVGVAASGAVLSGKLHGQLAGLGGHGEAALAAGIDQIRALAEPERLAVVAAYRDAISTTFLMGIGIIGLAFLLVFLLPELPLRSGKPAE